MDKLRAKNYDGSAEEWSSILKYALISKNSQLESAVKESLEIQCSISGKDPKSTLSITFRTLVQDITQHLGTIELPQTDDTDDVDLFGWASQLADRRDELEDEAVKQQKSANVEAENIQTVQKQLDDLTQAKADHERELMSKFAMLLNEKKFELRRMQRVLETARVDPQQLKALKAGSSGKRGQKRSTRAANNESEDDESTGFDDMDVDNEKQRASDDGQDTDDGRTESDEEDDLDQSATTRASTAPKTRSQPSSELPAPRELPFTRQKEKEQTSASQTTGISTPKAAAEEEDDEATASEDDEL